MEDKDNLIVSFLEPGTPDSKEVLAVIVYPGGAKDDGDNKIPDKIMEYFFGLKKGTVDEFRKNHQYQSEDELKAVDEYITRVYEGSSEIDFSTIGSERLRFIRICEYLGGGLEDIKSLNERQNICAAYPDEYFKPAIICDEKCGIAGYSMNLMQYAIKQMNSEGRRSANVFLQDEPLQYILKCSNI